MNKTNNIILLVILICICTNIFKLSLEKVWWIYIIPLFVLGVIFRKFISRNKIFLIGFFTNFFHWIVLNVCFYLSYSGEFIEQYDWSQILLGLLTSATIAGILSGLAILLGYNFYRIKV